MTFYQFENEEINTDVEQSDTFLNFMNYVINFVNLHD